jgi:hypothetical protein
MNAGRCAAEVAALAPLAPSICVFDVNETLLDIEFVAPLFHRLFDDRKVLREWFEQLILYSDAITRPTDSSAHCLSEPEHEIRRRERTQNVYVAKRPLFKDGTRSALR